MNWIRSLGQMIAATVAAVVLIHLFYSGRLAEIELQQKNIAAQFDYIESYLGKLDKRIGDISGRLAQPSAGSSASPDDLTDEKVDYLEQRIIGLEQAIEDLYGPEPATVDDAGGLTLPLPPPEPGVSENWFASLSPEKQALVQEAYQEQLNFIQDEVSGTAGTSPPEPGEMRSILTASRGQLEAKLQQILSREEYQTFLGTGSAPLLSR